MSTKPTVIGCDPASRPRLELRLADHRLAHLLAQAQVEHVLERRRRQRAELAHGLRVAHAEVALGVAGLEECLAEYRG